MVFPREYIQSVEIYWLLLVGTRKTCVTLDLCHVMTLIIPSLYSGVGKKCCLVRSSTLSTVVRITLLFQFLDYTRYYGLARCWDGHNRLFLL